MKLASIFLACLLAAGAAQAAHTAPIPVEQFFNKPAVTGASISPDGRHVALRMTSPAGRSMLNVIDADARTQKIVANFRNADVDMFYWQSDQRLIYSTVNVDHGGDIGNPGLYAVDRDGKRFKTLSRTIERQRSFADGYRGGSNYLSAPTINGFPYRKSESMFVIANTDDEVSLALIGTHDGRIFPVHAPRRTYRWLSDPNGDIRVAVTRINGKDVMHFKDEGGWRELASFDPDSAGRLQPLLYEDGKLYVRAFNGKNESSIYLYDVTTNKLGEQPVITVPGYDAEGYFTVNDVKALGFRVDAGSETTIWFDESMKALQREVDALLPGDVNIISYGAHSETPHVLIDTYNDTQGHLYLLFNRDTKKILNLGEARPGLDATRMSRMAMVRYPARDGLQIPAYLTLPAGGPKKSLPTIVLVSDPQWQRTDRWQWNAEVQFLASRGYAVLQPQTRGMPGFGRAHEAAGAKQWGLAMQDDIADAVKWSVAQGHTDPARVCIAGTGYGGYAAMMGLIRDPALFKCGVSWSGITDITSMFNRDWKDTAGSLALSQLRAMVGDPKADAEQFQATSPLHNAARIKQPVLLAYGKEDGRVPFSDGRKFYQALSATNPQVEWLEYTPSVEDWKTQGNSIDLWRRIEAFLGKHLGAATPGS
ncbi:S9 family peptidase [Duganella sp. PWIR1]